MGDAGRKHGAPDTTPGDNIVRFKKRQQAEVEKAMELIDHYRARRA